MSGELFKAVYAKMIITKVSHKTIINFCRRYFLEKFITGWQPTVAQ